MVTKDNRVPFTVLCDTKSALTRCHVYPVSLLVANFRMQSTVGV